MKRHNDPYSKFDKRRTLIDCFIDLFNGEELDERVESYTFKTYNDGSTVALSCEGGIVAYVVSMDEAYTPVPEAIPSFVVKPMREALRRVAAQRVLDGNKLATWRNITKPCPMNKLQKLQADQEMYNLFRQAAVGGSDDGTGVEASTMLLSDDK
jgi:hypothetical protein